MNPFQIQSIAPVDSSISLESQSIGCFTNSQPCLSQTSAAKSRSKPTYSPLSSRYPYGGNSASNPTVKVFWSEVDSLSASSDFAFSVSASSALEDASLVFSSVDTASVSFSVSFSVAFSVSFWVSFDTSAVAFVVSFDSLFGLEHPVTVIAAIPTASAAATIFLIIIISFSWPQNAAATLLC